MPYASNKDAMAICNRSGWKMRRSEMVEDGYLRGLLVHPDWYDPPHPQEQPFPPDEGIAIFKPAPDLIPSPPAAVLTGNKVSATMVLTWVQPDPPATTVINWQVWKSVAGQPATLIATVTPVVPADLFFQGSDLRGGELPPKVTGLTYTDTPVPASGVNLYYLITVTADGGREGSPGMVSAPSNTVQATF